MVGDIAGKNSSFDFTPVLQLTDFFVQTPAKRERLRRRLCATLPKELLRLVRSSKTKRNKIDLAIIHFLLVARRLIVLGCQIL